MRPLPSFLYYHSALCVPPYSNTYNTLARFEINERFKTISPSTPITSANTLTVFQTFDELDVCTPLIETLRKYFFQYCALIQKEGATTDIETVTRQLMTFIWILREMTIVTEIGEAAVKQHLHYIMTALLRHGKLDPVLHVVLFLLLDELRVHGDVGKWLLGDTSLHDEVAEAQLRQDGTWHFDFGSEPGVWAGIIGDAITSAENEVRDALPFNNRNVCSPRRLSLPTQHVRMFVILRCVIEIHVDTPSLFYPIQSELCIDRLLCA